MGEESMDLEYFQRINAELFRIGRASWVADEEQLVLRRIDGDVRILQVFCLCLQTWDYSIDEENEESMERLTSVIASLKLIWPKDFTLLTLLLERMNETRPVYMCLRDFDSVMYEMEGLILRCKRLVEGWCLSSIHSSMMQCKSSNSWQMLDFLRHLGGNLISFSRYRGDETVPLNKLINVLKAKIEFLEGNLIKVMHCPDGKEINEILNFIGNFANNVACITCLCWAKEEDDDEIDPEMNTVLFDMLHKFIPYAYDVTPLYVGLLKAYDLQLVSHSFRLEEAVESFVDFFFDHLATVLKDDFLFLRDRLLFLFTFLIDPLCENAEEGDLIRSQTYAILHEDVYLLMSFDDMNEDFSENKALLSGFMTRIGKANTKIRRLYCGSSDFWITLEVENMEYDYVVSVHRELSSFEKCSDGNQLYRTFYVPFTHDYHNSGTFLGSLDPI